MNDLTFPCLGLPRSPHPPIVENVLGFYKHEHEGLQSSGETKPRHEYLVLQGLLSDAWLENAELRKQVRELTTTLENLKRLGFEF